MLKEIIYKSLDIITAGKGIKRNINGYTLRMPTRYFKYFPEDYEKENFTFLATCKKGDVVLDIGAHIGMFAVIASQITGKGGKVYAFEPAPGTFDLLKKTIAINAADNVITPLPQAVGAAVGKTTFFVSDSEADNGNSMVSYKEDRKLNGIDIDITTVDTVVKEKNLAKVNFIKIDVEGVEYDTLRGATETLKNLRPLCIVSIHPEPIAAKGDKLEDIYDLMKDLNYKITLDGKEMSRDEFLANKEQIDLHIYPL
jgi:FkbM family methyltransferase